MRGQFTRARGQALIMVALAFAVFLLGVICLVADAAVLFRWSARVQAAAQLAAESGADAVSPGFLYADGSCSGAASSAACSDTIVDTDPQDRRNGLYAFERACIQSGDQSAGIARTPDEPQQPDGTSCASDGCRVFAQVTRSVTLPIPFPGFPASVAVRAAFRAAPVVGATAPRSSCIGVTWVPANPSAEP